MERDDEIKGSGNSYTTTFRQYDPRLGKWLSTDPVTHHQFSPYSAFDNNPILYVDPKGSNAWKPLGNGLWEAEEGDGAYTLAEDAQITVKKAKEILAEQGKGTYVDVDGVEKSAVDPGDVVQLPFTPEPPKDLTNPQEVERFNNKLDELNNEQDATVKELKEVTKDYEYYRKGPQGASPDPSTGSKIGYGINALRKEMQKNELQDDTAKRGKLIRSYQDSLKVEEEK